MFNQRKKQYPVDRIISYLNFYFGDKFIIIIKIELKVVEGDMAKENLGYLKDYNELKNNVDAL